MTKILASGFIKPCLPSKVTKAPSGSLWVHEIKHDGYRLMVRRDGSRIRCFTRNGNDWADRFPSIVEAAARLEANSFLIDGEVVIISIDGCRTSMRCGADAGGLRRCCMPSTCWSTMVPTSATCR